MSGRLARQRGADTEVRVTKVSPSLRMLNPRVLQHRCAPVQSPGTERSKSALRQSITYVKFIEKFRLTLSHEGTTHCDLSKLRARHTKRHMNEGNAKKGPHSAHSSRTRSRARGFFLHLAHVNVFGKDIPGTCVQYAGLQGGGALGDALTPGTPAGSMVASAHGGTYSHVAVVGGASGGERGAASATAAAAARRRRAAPTGEADTPPRSAPARGGQGGQHGARAGGWD